MNYFNRFKKLISDLEFEKIKNLRILIIGIGGVGGYALEGLVRSGVENITIIDHDIIDETNLNRQIITNTINIGNKKVEEAKKRAELINPNISIKNIDIFLNEETINSINFNNYDYVIDSCDTVNTKKLIIKNCLDNKIKFISCTGTANKFHPEMLSIIDLKKTNYDKLAKVLRKWVKDNNIEGKIPVVASSEVCKKVEGLGSTSFVPSVAGMLLVSYVINDSLKQKEITN